MNRQRQNEDTTPARRSFLKRLGALALVAGMPAVTGSFRSGHAVEVAARDIDGGKKRIETATFALG